VIQVDAPSRLHFGLLSLHTTARRQFGGAGVMIGRPGLRLRIAPADTVTAAGPLAERAAGCARTVLAASELDLPLEGAAIEVLSAPPQHAGLGTGTQLAFAVARGLLALADVDGVSTRTLARLLGRGRRSAIGVHGFGQGGLLVDGGKRQEDGIAPIVSHLPIWRDWRFVLVIPRSLRGLHGQAEVRAFDRMPSVPPETTAELCRTMLLEMLPAALERDVRRFGEAVYELNRRVGECFATQQGGIYAGGLPTQVVEFIRSQGIAGVGQSSWGPTVFAVTGSDDEATTLVRTVRNRMGLDANEVVISPPANDGARIEPVETDARSPSTDVPRFADGTRAH